MRLASFCRSPYKMDLCKIVRKLDLYFQPQYAENWDNVGLLLEPSPPHIVNKILVTNDLTENVLDEAIVKNARLIISYHPPIFTPFKRLTQETWKERNIIRCIENKIAIYSPHTSVDAKLGGVNDWLLSPFSLSTSSPICFPAYKGDANIAIIAVMDAAFRKFCANNTISPTQINIKGNNNYLAKFLCPEPQLSKVKETALQEGVTIISETLIKKESSKIAGSGRLGSLSESLTLQEIVDKYKRLFKKDSLQLVIGKGKILNDVISCIGVCAGSGGSMLSQQPGALVADLFVTGEASHHEQLEIAARGSSLLLAAHCVSERGWLEDEFVPWLQNELRAIQNDLIVECSTEDKSPLLLI